MSLTSVSLNSTSQDLSNGTWITQNGLVEAQLQWYEVYRCVEVFVPSYGRPYLPDDVYRSRRLVGGPLLQCVRVLNCVLHSLVAVRPWFVDMALSFHCNVTKSSSCRVQ